MSPHRAAGRGLGKRGQLIPKPATARVSQELHLRPENIEDVANFKAVIFDWRGTLVFTPSELEWARCRLQRAGRDASDEAARRVLDQIEGAPGIERLSAPGVDSDAGRHREAYFAVFRDAGLDPILAQALYEVESGSSSMPCSCRQWRRC